MRERLLSYLVEQGDMTESQKEIVGYGVSILFHNVITILVLLIGGLLVGKMSQTVLFIVCIISLRRNSGGYHAKTRLGCLFMSIAMWGMVVIADAMFSKSIATVEIATALFCVMDVMVWYYAPVEHYNKPLTMEIRKKNKWRACLLMVFFEIIDLLCMAKLPRISNVIMICLLEVVILMLWGERRRRHYEVKRIID